MAEAENNAKKPHTEEIIRLDGKMLEGGGQLVRNAVALSALTGKPITITDIRGKRQGKTGLKGSHTAAIKFLSEICQGEVIGGEVGSKTLTFYPRGRLQNEREEQTEGKRLLDLTLANGELPTVKPEYTVHQSTVGSIFLIFQAVYPYLVYASSLAGKPVRLQVTGGTNVSCAPSFEYIDQVLVPNLQKIGLPELSVRLNGRGWSTGPKELGAVTFLIHPLQASGSDVLTHGADGSISSGFPALNLSQFKRATITKIDITILAPDVELGVQEAQGNRSDRRKAGREGIQHEDYETFNPRISIREYLEEKTHKNLRRSLKQIPDKQLFSPSVADEDDDEIVPISLHTSEATYNNTHLYILLVAHTSTGLTIGADALFDGFKSRSSNKRHSGKHRGDKGENSMISTLDGLVEKCVDNFIQELSGRPDEPGPESSNNKHRPCVDVHMRDQLVIFDALGSLELQWEKAGGRPVDIVKDDEDKRYWSLHTRTARWVCEQILGEGVWGGD
ncbi:hypothetical protein PISL3812_04192 [Talaromyces islandicus]|uniref:RNA 3'-terminal phosphate cyclase domain-containing protein n=1 Tax=Talaromyces islandicus TaxID=28573 RepID=A0A0U1LVD6_TALIS|nr:hypothetical protein PISL3812_04192 [Talaromyces islandicus]